MKGSVPASLSDYAASTANYAAVTYSRTALFAKRLETLARLYHVCQAGAVPHFLDIGASSGMLVKLARQKGWAADGLEPSSTGTRAALVQGLVFPQGVAEAIPFASQSFDIVHSHHVFEHLADPLQAIQEAYRLLRPGGLLYIEVPNQFDNIMFQRDIWLGRVPQRQRNLRSIHHLWFFSRRTLMRLFQEAGFRDVHVKDFYAWRPQGWRAPLQWLTRIMGAFFYGGHLLSAWGWK
jgi:SAM-dependent methyltransferase